MNWTQEQPTRDGWYWLKVRGLAEVECARVNIDPSIRKYDQVRFGDLWYRLNEPMFQGAWWCGPLTPPEPPPYKKD